MTGTKPTSTPLRMTWASSPAVPSVSQIASRPSGSLKALVGMAGDRRTWAVLGEMRELGPDSAAEHDAVGRLAVRLDVARLVVVGPDARPMHLGASLEGSWGEESVYVPDVDAAVTLLREQVRPGDIVLVKASRAAGLERVATALLDQLLDHG